MSSLAILGAFIRRDWAIDFSYRASFFLQIAAPLFNLTLFFYLGRVIDNAEFASSQGLQSGYFGFVAVGLVVLTMVQTSLISFSRKLREEQTTGTFEALMTTPAGPTLIILSSAAYEILRGVIDGLLLLAAAMLIFGLALDTTVAGIALAVVALVGALGLFASLGVAVAALTVLFKRTTVILGAVITVLALLGGVYFPIDVLPDPIATVAAWIPFTWALDVLRSSLLGGVVDPAQLIGLLVAVPILLPAALWGFRLAVQRARRTGTLAEY